MLFSALLIAGTLCAVAIVAIGSKSSSSGSAIASLTMRGLPVGILATAYAASQGMSIGWAAVAAGATGLGLALAAMTRKPDFLAVQMASRSVALILSGSALVSLGLAVVGIAWATSIITGFSNLNGLAVKFALVATALAVALGRRAKAGLGRIALGVSVAAVAIVLVFGLFLGSPGSLFSPLAPERNDNPGLSWLYALTAVAIGAAYPALQPRSRSKRRTHLIAAIVTAALLFVGLLGILMLLGGAYAQPNLSLDLLAVAAPVWLSAVICALAAIVGAIMGGLALTEGLDETAPLFTTRHAPVITPVMAVVGALIVLVVLFASPSTTDTAVVMALIAAVALVARLRLAKMRESDVLWSESDAPSTQESTSC